MGWYEEWTEKVTEWKTKSKTITFCGEHIIGMSKDELLAVIGFMALDAESDRQRHEQYASFMKDLSDHRVSMKG